jgi:hypothetical protein
MRSPLFTVLTAKSTTCKTIADTSFATLPTHEVDNVVAATSDCLDRYKISSLKQLRAFPGPLFDFSSGLKAKMPCFENFCSQISTKILGLA